MLKLNHGHLWTTKRAINAQYYPIVTTSTFSLAVVFVKMEKVSPVNQMREKVHTLMRNQWQLINNQTVSSSPMYAQWSLTMYTGSIYDLYFFPLFLFYAYLQVCHNLTDVIVDISVQNKPKSISNKGRKKLEKFISRLTSTDIATVHLVTYKNL